MNECLLYQGNCALPGRTLMEISEQPRFLSQVNKPLEKRPF